MADSAPKDGEWWWVRDNHGTWPMLRDGGRWIADPCNEELVARDVEPLCRIPTPEEIKAG